MISFTVEQHFLVTGASSGIGESVALLLNELGGSVIGIGRDERRLAAMKAKAAHPENILLEVKDLVEDIAGLPQYVKSLREKYGKFSGFAYCAGISEVRPIQLWDYADSCSLFDVNYFAPMAMLKGFGDCRNHAGKGSAAVLIASASAVLADKGHISYAGSKAALVTSCKAAAKELAISGVRVNTISPTVISTPMTTMKGADYEAAQFGKYPLGFGEAADVANLAAFLLSDRARWITGQNYLADCASF